MSMKQMSIYAGTRFPIPRHMLSLVSIQENSDKYPTSVTYFFITNSAATQVTIFNVVSICQAGIVYFVV